MFKVIKKISGSKKIIISFLTMMLYCACANSMGREYILVYSGPGADEKCIQQSIVMLIKHNLQTTYKIRTVDYHYLSNEKWQSKTKLLVMPGGSDLPYAKYLSGATNNKIKQFVQDGGNYLGICAGAYYAGSHIEWRKGEFDLEILAERELSFFPGTVKGPMHPGFTYYSYKGVIAAEILLQNGKINSGKSQFFVYYHGGGYFAGAEKEKNIDIIASYGKEKRAAIIKGNYGKGQFVLSGVHFEMDPKYLNCKDKYLKNIIPLLDNNDAYREQLACNVLNILLR